MRFWNWLLKYWQELTVVLLAAGFFVACCFYINAVQEPDLVKWSSPDETANYFFAKHYSETGELFFYEDLNVQVGDIVYPRSMRSDGGMVKPVSFLGLPILYGNLASWYSPAILPYLTPFFAAVGIFFYYLLIRKVFGRNAAFLSVFLLAMFPVYFYYSVRSFFHNVLFIDFLVAGLYFAILASDRGPRNLFLAWRWSEVKGMNWRNFFFASLAGFLIGFSVTIRASEALWLVPALGLIWLLNFRKYGLLKLILFLSFAASAFLPQVYWNKVLYGDFRSGGYTEMNRSISSIAVQGSEAAKKAAGLELSSLVEPLKRIKASIFYFGFNPDRAGESFNGYFVRMFSWLFWSSALGLLLFLLRLRKHKKRHWCFLLSWLLSSSILVLYYGSWRFNDNPDPKDITIGNSYTRYWLPVYMGAMPFASFFLLRFSWAIFAKEDGDDRDLNIGWRGFWRNFWRWRIPGRDFSINAFRALALVLLSFLSATFVFYGSKEGLVYSFLNKDTSLDEYRQVLSLTESNSVIITKYHDKLFFPSRRVIVGLFDDDGLNDRYRLLLDRVPVYYYNFNLPSKDLEYLNERKLKESGLGLSMVKRVNNAFSLYRLEKKSPSSE